MKRKTSHKNLHRKQSVRAGPLGGGELIEKSFCPEPRTRPHRLGWVFLLCLS